MSKSSGRRRAAHRPGLWSELGLHPPRQPLPGLAHRSSWVVALCASATASLSAVALADVATPVSAGGGFEVAEASIADIQSALLSKRVTTVQIVRAYLARIKAYNGTCVKQPQGILGVIEPVPNAGQINALMTLNLRPAARRQMGFDDRKARSMTDAKDANAGMPDALEVAAAQDRQFAATGKLVGPLQGVMLSIKDQYDTFDMRSTAGQDVAFANDRPPDDAHFIAKLRAAGAIILAKANLGEGGSQRSRSSFGGTMCNPYDTTRSPGSSSGGSGSSVGASLVTCAMGEETGGSILHPARNASAVGLAPTQQLVSQDGIFGKGFNHRVGPICRNVEDTARILEVIAGFDPDDEITAFSIGRLPSQPYSSFRKGEAARRVAHRRSARVHGQGPVHRGRDTAHRDRRAGDRGAAQARRDDRRPGPARRAVPELRGQVTCRCIGTSSSRSSSPASSRRATDPIPKLVDLSADPKKVPKGPNIRNLGPAPDTGEGRYFLEQYLKQRGDANIRTIDDLMNKAQFFTDLRSGSDFTSYKEQLARTKSAKELDLAALFQNRLAYQTIVLTCMGTMQLDAVTYGSGVGVAPVLDRRTSRRRTTAPTRTASGA
ncbi:MAG: amidase family protein [Gammaproteobacteria bacterium]